MLTKFNSKDNFWDLFESRDYIVSRMVHVPSKDCTDCTLQRDESGSDVQRKGKFCISRRSIRFKPRFDCC